MLLKQNPSFLWCKTLGQIDFNKNHKLVQNTKYACCDSSVIIEIQEIYDSNRRIWRRNCRFVIVRKTDPGWRRAESDRKNTQYCERQKKHAHFDHIWQNDTYNTDLTNMKKCDLPGCPHINPSDNPTPHYNFRFPAQTRPKNLPGAVTRNLDRIRRFQGRRSFSCDPQKGLGTPTHTPPQTPIFDQNPICNRGMSPPMLVIIPLGLRARFRKISSGK